MGLSRRALQRLRATLGAGVALAVMNCGARSNIEGILGGTLRIALGGALEELKKLIQETRLRTVLSANAAMIQLYWEMGQRIRERQAREGWGREGHRPALGRPARGFPEHVRVVITQPPLHA